MKKILSILLTCFLLSMSMFVFSACGGGDNTGNVNNGGETPPEHTHVFNKQVISDEYKKADATCESPAEYYYVCSCWEKGSETFKNGSELGHSYGEWTSNGNGTHTQTCKNDSTHKITKDCSGGVATETQKAVCEICNTEYGATLNHTHTFDKQVISDEYKKVDATCESPAEYYYVCSCWEKGSETFKNGSGLGHSYGEWTSNGDGTHTQTCKNDSTHKTTKDCSGGTATCEKLAKCLDCKEEYGELSDHKYENGKCKWCEIKKPSEGLIYTLINNGTKYEVSSVGDCKDTDVVIPSIYNDKIVTSIGSNAFSSCESLTSIEIPASVTSIGDYAFWNCDSLTSIEIQASVTSIGDRSFSRCSSLESIKVDGNNTKYKSIDGNLYSIDGKTLIQYAIGKTAVSFLIPDSVTSIGEFAFSSCSSLTSIEIPDSVTSIGELAFSHCTSLTSIEIPDSVTSIENQAFLRCESLESIEIPASVTSIGYEAFCNCSNLKTVALGENSQLESIGKGVFYKCDSLTSIEIPNSVTSIGDGAFHYCRSLESIEIPDGVTSIGDYAFSFCGSLTSIEIPNSVTSIGYGAFYVCNSLRYNEKDGLKYLGNSNNKYLYLADTVPNEITTAIIDVNCKFIGYSAFDSCSSLTSIEIPASVTSIGEGAFYECSNLKTVTFGENSQLESIGSSAFDSCSSLTSIEIPASVTSIGDSAFYECSNLKTVTFGENSKLTSIGDFAFSYCYSLTSIEIPASVTSIGEMAFLYCESLTSIEIPDSVTSIGYYAFASCDKLTDIYCEAESQPSGWNSNWKGRCDATVHWGYKGE